MMWAGRLRSLSRSRRDSSKAVVESVTARWGITAYAAHNNLLRGATEAMAAAIGGCDSIEVTPFDAAFKPSGDFSRRLARNTQVILKQEAYLDRVADPGGGSYYVEALTASLAREAWKLFQQVEAKGGMLKSCRRVSCSRKLPVPASARTKPSRRAAAIFWEPISIRTRTSNCSGCWIETAMSQLYAAQPLQPSRLPRRSSWRASLPMA